MYFRSQGCSLVNKISCDSGLFWRILRLCRVHKHRQVPGAAPPAEPTGDTSPDTRPVTLFWNNVLPWVAPPVEPTGDTSPDTCPVTPSWNVIIFLGRNTRSRKIHICIGNLLWKGGLRERPFWHSGVWKSPVRRWNFTFVFWSRAKKHFFSTC